MNTLLVILGVSVAHAALAGEGFQISSPAFKDGGAIPARHSRAGGNVSPPLIFSGVPAAAKSLALVVDDPDAPGGVWVHWLVANLPADIRKLDAGESPAAAVIGANSWSAPRYDGPQPPKGRHHYVFSLYAVDARLDLKPGFTRVELDAVLKGHVLALAQGVGTFAR